MNTQIIIVVVQLLFNMTLSESSKQNILSSFHFFKKLWEFEFNAKIFIILLF